MRADRREAVSCARGGGAVVGLTLEGHKVSDCSRADVVLCYLENKVDRKLLDEVRQKLAKIDVRSVSMSQESIAEAMMGKKQWWTPFP